MKTPPMLDTLGQDSSTRKFDQMIGNSPTFESVLEQVKRAAPTDSTVLIEAESSTCKELIAKAIHLYSNRSNRQFVKDHRAAILRGSLESHRNHLVESDPTLDQISELETENKRLHELVAELLIKNQQLRVKFEAVEFQPDTSIW
jgi:transcriptional regulator of acetoin/glycerol metabolism